MPLFTGKIEEKIIQGSDLSPWLLYQGTERSRVLIPTEVLPHKRSMRWGIRSKWHPLPFPSPHRWSRAGQNLVCLDGGWFALTNCWRHYIWYNKDWIPFCRDHTCNLEVFFFFLFFWERIWRRRWWDGRAGSQLGDCYDDPRKQVTWHGPDLNSDDWEYRSHGRTGRRQSHLIAWTGSTGNEDGLAILRLLAQAPGWLSAISSSSQAPAVILAGSIYGTARWPSELLVELSH